MEKQRRPPRKPVRRVRAADPIDMIQAQLPKLKKAELVDLLCQACRDPNKLRRELEVKLAVDKPADLPFTDIEAAIRRATDVDENMLNYNFDFDWAAFEEVERV